MSEKVKIGVGWIIVGMYLVINLWLLGDYSLTWDSFIHFAEAEKTTDYLRFRKGEISKLPYGLWPTMLSHLSYMIFYGKLGILNYEMAHLLPIVLIGVIGVGVVYFFALEAFGWMTAIFSSLFLAIYPHYLVSIHTNVKDLPMAVVYALVIWLFWRAVKRKSLIDFVIAGMALGLSLATKINAFFLPVIFLIWLVFFYFKQIDWRRKTINKVPWARWIIFTAAALMSMYILWPYLWFDPVGRLVQTVGFFSNILKSRQILYFGKMYPVVGKRPWHYAFGYLGVVTPCPVLVLFGLGFLYSVYQVVSKRGARYGLLLLWFLIPTGKYIILNIEVFDNIRHFLEVVFPLVILAGIGVQSLGNLLKRKMGKCLVYTMMLILMIPTLRQLVQLHPYQNAYYNALVGSIAGAKGKFDLDYWGFSLKEGCGWLNHQAEEGATIVVPLATQVARFYLRGDLNVRESGIEEGDYVMVFDKPSDFSEKLREYRQIHQPIFSIDRKGVELLSIYRNT